MAPILWIGTLRPGKEKGQVPAVTEQVQGLNTGVLYNVAGFQHQGREGWGQDGGCASGQEGSEQAQESPPLTAFTSHCLASSVVSIIHQPSSQNISLKVIERVYLL